MTLLNKKVLHSLTMAVLLSSQSQLVLADSACHYVEQASLDIAHSSRSAFATVDGELNGRPIKLALDTGASVTALLRSAVEKQGLEPFRTRMQIQGVGGNTSMFKVNIKDIAIGNAHAKNLTFPVIDALDDKDAAGIVGVDFLMQYDVELDLAASHVKLFRADHCKDRALAYWDKDAASVPMAYISDTPRPRVQVKINGETIWALIDSGASLSVVDLDTARRLGKSTDGRGVSAGGAAVGIGSNTRTLWNMTFDSFAIGDEVIQHPRLAVMDTAEHTTGRRAYDMILGRDFLRAHRVLLAQSQMLVYFSYNGGPVFIKDDSAAL
jgi:predicted aspartyl protease